jgi:DNA-binding SARP family transcriptional activator/tetratricopeptide (TPR) repeat protein/DNA-binding XRE family transcriptional regulator
MWASCSSTRPGIGESGMTAAPSAGPGDLIRRQRLAAGLSQRELARLAQVSVGTLRDLEQGRTRRPHARLLNRLAEALRLDGEQAAQLATGSAPAGAAHDQLFVPRDGLWLRMLGPLAGWRDGVPLALGSPRQRAVLGLLALHAGSSVHRSELVDGVWGQDPPAAAVNLVQAYVGRLRQTLDAGRSPRSPDGVLVSTGRSYRLQVGPNELDWLRFRDLTSRTGAAIAAGDLVAGCRLYEQALALWQGEPLADIDGLRSGTAVTVVRRAWAAAVGEYGHAAITAALADRALPHLWALTERDPLNEKAHALLMRALAADGEQAAALRVFDDIRERLDSQLGIRPGAEVSEVQLLILRQQIPSAAVRPVAPADAGVTPRQLPTAVPGFVGRTDELKTLDRLLDDRDAANGSGGTVVISAIDGAAGIGKTALAVHWAHTVAGRFPDGQLYVDLRGFDPVAPPLNNAEAIRGFLDALAVPADRMPSGIDAQAAMYRSLLAGRRVLVVLDNARDSEQVRPLLPASRTCLVVVTSRRQLTGLTVAEGAHQITVDLLNRSDARQLLSGRLGASRVDAQREAVDELVDLCAGLPLALSIAGARGAARPDFPITTLVSLLRDARQQLDTLSGGDPASDLRTLFSCSYRYLSSPAARLFRLLGLHAGPDISLPVAASLAGLGRRPARRALDELTSAYLLAERVPGRYVLHNLLRTYAGELALQQDSEAERTAAIDRTFDHYLHSLDAADRLWYPACRPIQSSTPLPGVTPAEFTDPDRALDWCQDERPVLMAMFGQTAEAGPDAYVSGSRWILWLYFHLWSHWNDLAEARRVVSIAAHPVGGGQVAPPEPPVDTDRPDDVRYTYRFMIELGQLRGEQSAKAYCLFGLTQMLNRTGRHAEAREFATRALDWFRATGDRAGTALALNQIGRYQIHIGQPDQAVRCCQQALDLCRELGERTGEAFAADSLGLATHRLGRYAEAACWCERAAVIYGELGERDGQIEALIHLGDARQALADERGAAHSWQAALALLEDPHHPHANVLRSKLAGAAGRDPA